MLNYFRYYRLNSFLSSTCVTTKSTECIRFDLMGKATTQIFNLSQQDGRRNFSRVIQMVYDRYPAAVRIKLLVLVHYLVSEDRAYAEYFLDQPRCEFQGVVITKKPQRQGYTEPCGDYTMRGAQTSVSVSRVCITRKCIDDAFDFKDVNNYLHMYLIQPYLGYIMKLAANYDLYDQCRTQFKQIRKADFPLTWKIINMIKSILQVKVVLTHVGRYYFNDYTCIVSFIEMLTRNLTLFYEMLQFHLTTALDGYKNLSFEETENLLGILDQVVELNEALYEIYYNRYFSKLTKHVPAPKWLTLENDQSDTIYSHFRMLYGDVKVTQLKEPGVMIQHHDDPPKRLQELDEIQIPLN